LGRREPLGYPDPTGLVRDRRSSCLAEVLLSRLDPRQPLVVDLRELGRRPGSMLKVDRTVPAPADLGLDVIGVPEGSDLGLQLRLESVVEGVLVSGVARLHFVGECVRCLDDLAFEHEVSFQELYFYSDQSVDDVEALRVQDDLIDLDPVLRDAVVPGLPFQPLCREDCPGLCAECGVRLADEPDHRHDPVDPRWAALVEFPSSPEDPASPDDVKEES